MSGCLFLLPEHLCCCRFRDSLSVVVRTFPTIKRETKLIPTCQTKRTIFSMNIPRIVTQPNLTKRTKMLLSTFCEPRVSTTVAIQHAHRPTIDGLCTIVWTNECDQGGQPCVLPICPVQFFPRAFTGGRSAVCLCRRSSAIACRSCVRIV